MPDLEDYVPERADGTTLALWGASQGSGGGGGGGGGLPDPTPEGKTLFRVVTTNFGNNVLLFPELANNARLTETTPFGVSVNYSESGPSVMFNENLFPVGLSHLKFNVSNDLTYDYIEVAVNRPDGVTQSIPPINIGEFPNNHGTFVHEITLVDGVQFVRYEGGRKNEFWAGPGPAGYKVYIHTDPLSAGTYSLIVFGTLNGQLYQQEVTATVVNQVDPPSTTLTVTPSKIEREWVFNDEVETIPLTVSPFSGTTANRASGPGWSLGKINGQFVITVNPKNPSWAATKHTIDVITFTNGSETAQLALDLSLRTEPGSDFELYSYHSWVSKNSFGVYNTWTGLVMNELVWHEFPSRLKGVMTGVIESYVSSSGWLLSPKSVEWYIDDAVGIGVLAVQDVQEILTPFGVKSLDAANRAQSEWTIPLVLGQKTFLPPKNPLWYSPFGKYNLQLSKLTVKAYNSGVNNYLEAQFEGFFARQDTGQKVKCQIAGSTNKSLTFTIVVTRTITAVTGGFVDNTMILLGPPA